MMIHLDVPVVVNPYPWLEFEVLSWEKIAWYAGFEGVPNPCIGEWIFRRNKHRASTGPSGEGGCIRGWRIQRIGR